VFTLCCLIDLKYILLCSRACIIHCVCELLYVLIITSIVFIFFCSFLGLIKLCFCSQPTRAFKGRIELNIHNVSGLDY